MYSVPPFGFNYLSPGPPLLATPFITAATGVDNGQRFPFPFPSHTVSATNPDTSVNWSNFLPLAADPFFDHNNRVAYTESYMLSIQRQISRDTLLTVSYVGNQGHHILALVSANPGNPALCLSLPAAAPSEKTLPTQMQAGQTVQGTRVGQGPNYGENTADRSIANSTYNALEDHTPLPTSRFAASPELHLRQVDRSGLEPRRATQPHRSAPEPCHFGLGYEACLRRQLHHRASYRYDPPQEQSAHGTVESLRRNSLHHRFPVTLFDNTDNSLLGTLGNGANNYLARYPALCPGPLKINTDGRNGRAAFNTSLFPEEILGHLGNAKRRNFYGPGIENFDLTLQKSLHLTEARSLEFRVEAFNVFNHAQFYGPAAVDGQREDPSFGKISSYR
jgi:hypothetical protein